MNSTELDMRTRWTPSEEQDKQAAEVLQRWHADKPGARVFTAHLLVGKGRHFWTQEVQVVPLLRTGVLGNREAAYAAAEAALEAYQMLNPEKDVSAGWTVHRIPAEGEAPQTPGRDWLTSWAVFEA
jgi:hypothetical protein